MIFGFDMIDLLANVIFPTSPRIPRIVPLFPLGFIVEDCCALEICLNMRFLIVEFSSFSLFVDEELPIVLP
jgi:hypothetical protein